MPKKKIKWTKLYLVRMPFSSYDSLQVVFPCLPGMATLITVTILRIPDLDLSHIADILDWLFMVFPPYSLAAAITDLYTNHRFTKICDGEAMRLLCAVSAVKTPCCRGKQVSPQWQPYLCMLTYECSLHSKSSMYVFILYTLGYCLGT